MSSNFKSQDLQIWKSVLGPKAGTPVLFGKTLLLSPVWLTLCERSIQNGFGLNICSTKYKQSAIDLCQSAMQNRVETLITKVLFSSFLPPLLGSFQKPFHLFHINSFSYLRRGPRSLSFTLAWTCWLFIHSSFCLIFFSFLCTSTEEAQGLDSFFYYWCLLYSALNWSRDQFSLHWGCQ